MINDRYFRSHRYKNNSALINKSPFTFGRDIKKRFIRIITSSGELIIYIFRLRRAACEG